MAEPAEPDSSSASDDGKGHVSFAVDAEAHQASVVAAAAGDMAESSDEHDSGDDLWIRRDRGSDSGDEVYDGDRDLHARGFSQSAVSTLMALIGILIGLFIAQNLPGARGMSAASGWPASCVTNRDSGGSYGHGCGDNASSFITGSASKHNLAAVLETNGPKCLCSLLGVQPVLAPLSRPRQIQQRSSMSSETRQLEIVTDDHINRTYCHFPTRATASNRIEPHSCAAASVTAVQAANTDAPMLLFVAYLAACVVAGAVATSARAYTAYNANRAEDHLPHPVRRGNVAGVARERAAERRIKRRSLAAERHLSALCVAVSVAAGATACSSGEVAHTAVLVGSFALSCALVVRSVRADCSAMCLPRSRVKNDPGEAHDKHDTSSLFTTVTISLACVSLAALAVWVHARVTTASAFLTPAGKRAACACLLVAASYVAVRALGRWGRQCIKRERQARQLESLVNAGRVKYHVGAAGLAAPRGDDAHAVRADHLDDADDSYHSDVIAARSSPYAVTRLLAFLDIVVHPRAPHILACATAAACAIASGHPIGALPAACVAHGITGMTVSSVIAGVFAASDTAWLLEIFLACIDVVCVTVAAVVREQTAMVASLVSAATSVVLVWSCLSKGQCTSICRRVRGRHAAVGGLTLAACAFAGVSGVQTAPAWPAVVGVLTTFPRVRAVAAQVTVALVAGSAAAPGVAVTAGMWGFCAAGAAGDAIAHACRTESPSTRRRAAYDCIDSHGRRWRVHSNAYPARRADFMRVPGVRPAASRNFHAYDAAADTRYKERKRWKRTTAAVPPGDVIDSGASHTFVSAKDRQYIKDFRTVTGQDCKVANNRTIPIVGSGTFCKPYTDAHGDERLLVIPNACYCPGIARTLISVRSLRDLGHRVIFGDSDDDEFDDVCEDRVEVRDRTGEVVTQFPIDSVEGHYVLRAGRAYALSATKRIQSASLHRVFGHISPRAVNQGIKSGRITGITGSCDVHAADRCTVCAAAKMRQSNKRTSTAYKPTHVGEFIHVDTMTSDTRSTSGFKFVLGFVDSFSGARMSILMKKKSDCGAALEQFMQNATALGWFKSDAHKFCTFFSDNEFVDGTFAAMAAKLNQQHVETHGLDGPAVGHKYTSPHSSFSNGRAERAFRTLSDTTRCLLFDAKADAKYWDLAYLHATWLHNRIGTDVTNGISPFEIVTGKPPDVSHLLPWGSIVAKWNYNEARKKWDAKAKFVIFVGVDPQHPSASINVFDPATKRVTNTRSWRPIICDPDDTRTLMTRWREACAECPLPKHIDLDANEPFATVDEHDNDNDENVSLGARDPAASGRDSAWWRTPKDNMTPVTISRALGVDTEQYLHYLNSFDWDGVRPRGLTRRHKFKKGTDVPRPSKYVDNAGFGFSAAFAAMSAALSQQQMEPSHAQTLKPSNPYRMKWAEARLVHWKGHLDAGTFEIVRKSTVPRECKVSRGKWVYKVKTDPASGAVTRFKARFCARGFEQRPHIDFDPLAVSSSVIGLSSLRFLIAQSCRLGLEMTGIDISDAYVQADLSHELYLDIPRDVEGLATHDQDGHALCLRCKKALFGWTQAGRCWQDQFRATLRKLGCRRLKSDSNIHVYKGMWIGVYSDDCIICSPCRATRDEFVARLHAIHPLRDEGRLESMLGMKIDQSTTPSGARVVRLAMPSYISNVGARFGLAQCRLVRRPVGTDAKDLKATDELADGADKDNFRRKVGAVLWAAITTRPELCATVATCCKFMAKPTKRSCVLVDRCIRYLVSTPDHGITYTCDDPGMHNLESSGVTTWCDANWAGDADSAKSTTGVCLCVAGGVFEFYSRLQRSVSMSSTESECIALASAVTEVEFFRSLAAELGFRDGDQPWTVNVDNLSAINSAHNDGVRRTRHINIRFAKVRQCVEDKVIKLNHVNGGASLSSEQRADIFTKNCNGPLWDKFAGVVCGAPVAFRNNQGVT